MEDKRIIKTRKNIKATLIGLLQEMPFEKISVAEICRRAMTSRITFYTHYEDKYALIEEMFSDYITEADINYHKLQEKNNPRQDGLIGYRNLLEAMLCLFYDNYSFFSHTTARENPYLYAVYFDKVFCSVHDYLKHHNCIIPKYAVKQTAALLCNGLFGVINTCISDAMEEAEVRNTAHVMYASLLSSDLFMEACTL